MGLSHRLTRAEGRSRAAPTDLDRRTVLQIGRVTTLLETQLRGAGRIRLGEVAAAARADCGAGPEVVEVCVVTQVFLGQARVDGEYLAPAADERYASQIVDVQTVWTTRFRGRGRGRVRLGEFTKACRADRGAGPQAVRQFVDIMVGLGGARLDGDYLVQGP